MTSAILEGGFRILQENANDLYLREWVSEFDGPPDPLDFYRDFVSANVPVIFRNAAQNFEAVQKWTQQYLRDKVGDQLVTVAATPNGWADAVSDNRQYFMLPEEKKMRFSEFLNHLEDVDASSSPVLYMQQQNSNLTGEMNCLLGDVPEDINWATKAFGQKPDAANFWLGDGRAITSTHKDPYENIYCVIKGEKTFVLSPPTDLPGMNYITLPIAKYEEVRSVSEYKIVPSDDNSAVRWICPRNESAKKLPIRPKKLVAKVQAGDMLYLPSLWFHQVSQSHGCIAVNYWYDMKFDIKYAYFSMLEHLCAEAVPQHSD